MASREMLLNLTQRLKKRRRARISNFDQKFKRVDMHDLRIPENRISQEVIDACINIHMALGPGLFERIYENALIYELGEKRKFSLDHQFPVQAYYEDKPLGESFYADLIVDQKVILEIKSVERLLPVHFKQLLTYLRLADMKLGLLINFNEVRVIKGIHRIANGL